MAIVSNNGGAVNLPADLLKDASTPDINKDYFEVTITDLNVNTTYPIQFAWVYEDKTVSAYSATYNVTTSSVSVPTSISNLSATWEADGLKVTFDHDNSLSYNTGVDQYKLVFTYTGGMGPGGTGSNGTESGFDLLFEFTKTSLSKSYLLTNEKQLGKLQFDFFRYTDTTISPQAQLKVSVVAIDSTNGTESTAVEITTPQYTSLLNKPFIAVTPGEFSYSVTWQGTGGQSTDIIKKLWSSIIIEEVINNSDTAPISGWQAVRNGIENPIIVPVLAATSSKRWVRARFLESKGVYSQYSDAIPVTPNDPILNAIDNTPPPNVTAVSAVWAANGNLELTPTFAATDVITNTNDYSVRFLIDLTGTLNSITTTRTFFIWRTDMVGGKVILTPLDLYNRFGSCAYTTFTGLWKGADKADNINTGTAFSTSSARISSLSGITPTISASDISALADGFSIKFTLPSGATHAKVYKRATSWGNPNGQPTTTPTSAEIGGSGQSPVYVADTTYNTIYVRLAFSNDCGDLSLYSNELTTAAVNPVTLDTSPPPVPSVSVATPTLSGSKYQAVATITQSAGTDTKEYRIRYKPSTSSAYITELVKYVGTTTTYTINDLNPSTTYNISVASVDAANNTSAYSTDINFTTGALTVDPPASATLTASTAGAVASWTAPAVIRAPISRYKVELYRVGTPNVLVSTEYSFSTNMSFGGLSAGSYYINVYAEDIYGTSSTARTTSASPTTVSGVGTSDGLVPLSSPAAVVSALYGALEVKWTGLTLGPRSTTANPDPVTYEVHVSTTNNFTPSSSTLALQVDGTFAIIKTLPPVPTPPSLPTPLTYGTLYYVKILAKDADGPAASYGTQGSGTPSAIDNGDIAANAIRANVIQANTITSDQINSSALLANKKITVGARSAVVTAASVSGGNITYTTSGTHGFGNGTLVSVTGMSTAAFDITDFAIQSTTTNTFVVLVGLSGATGSLSNQTGVATSTVNTAIKIDASGTGLSASPFKLYSGTGTYADAGTNPGTPFYLDTNGRFSLRDRLTFDGNSTLTVNGTVNATGGIFTGYVETAAGGMRFGRNVNGIDSGLYINANNFWYNTGNFSVGAANNTVTWNGTALTVTGAINARSGNFQGNVKVTDGSVYSGTEVTAKVSTYSGSGGQATFTTDIAHGLISGVVITVSGLTGANSSSFNGTFITQAGTTGSTIVANPQTSTNIIPAQTQITGQTGAILNVSTGYVLNTKGLTFGNNTIIDAASGKFITKSANIGGWSVDESKFERGSFGGTAGTGTYTGISSTGTYAFWAGSDVSGGNSASKFSVTPAGAVQASNISLIGTQVVDTNFIVAGPSANPVFKVTQDGKLTATSADITGKITASSGKVGNVNIDSASLYITDTTATTGTAPNIFLDITKGNRIIFNSGGIAAYPTAATTNSITGSESTITDYNSMTANFAITKTGTAFFKKGFIGGWEITSTQIKGSTGTATTVLQQDGTMYGNNGTYWVGLNPQTTAGTDIVLWAGQVPASQTNNIANSKSAAAFSVTAAGALKATDAAITGNITATGGFFTGNLNFGSPISVTYTVTSASISGSFITYVISNPTTPFQLSSGSTVTISGASNNGYNGAKVIDSVLSATSFRVPVGSTSGTTTFSGGQAVGTPVAARIGIAAGGSGLHGIYIPNTQGTSNPAGDFMYSDGSFSFGGGQIKGTANSISFDFNKYTSTVPPGQGMFFTNMLSGDDDNWAGDPTITVRDSDFKVVKGRRFLFDGRVTGVSTDLPVNPKDLPAGSTIVDARTGLPVTLPNPTWTTGTTKTGYYKRKTSVTGVFEYYPVKVGDLLLID